MWLKEVVLWQGERETQVVNVEQQFTDLNRFRPQLSISGGKGNKPAVEQVQFFVHM